MAKPIVVIYIPENLWFSHGGVRLTPMDLMDALNGEFGRKDAERKYEHTDYWKEYYWFCFYKPGIDAPEFKVFHEKDFTDIQFLELKKLIDDSIQELKSIPQQ